MGEPASGPGVNREFVHLALQVLPPPHPHHHPHPVFARRSLPLVLVLLHVPLPSACLPPVPRRGSSLQSNSQHQWTLFYVCTSQCALDQAPVDQAGRPHPRAWEFSPELRTYWFSEDAAVGAAEYRACGALLGHSILSETLLAPVFPHPVHALLLRALGSPNTPAWSIADMAKVSPSMALGLEELVEYPGDDVADMYPLDWPRGAELATLDKHGRPAYVQGYVEWYFTERFERQAKGFCEGFVAVVGRSRAGPPPLVHACVLRAACCAARARPTR